MGPTMAPFTTYCTNSIDQQQQQQQTHPHPSLHQQTSVSSSHLFHLNNSIGSNGSQHILNSLVDSSNNIPLTTTQLITSTASSNATDNNSQIIVDVK